MKHRLTLFTTLVVSLLLLGCSNATQPVASKPVDESVSLGDNSRVSIDWHGTYTGVTPCADCEGIQTELILSMDGFYKLSLQYVGKSNTPFVEHGKFIWDESGSKIALLGLRGGQVWYRVGENRLMMLDQNGLEIKSSMGTYELQKTSLNALVEAHEEQVQEIYWKLIGVMGKAVVLAEKQREPYIMLKIENNRVQGFGGCNLMMGTYTLSEGKRIRFSKMASTMMACPNLEEEHTFFKILEQVDNYTIKDGVLMLNKARMAPLATFEAVYMP